MSADFRRIHHPFQQGFTLLELLVVVVIVAILFTYTTLAIRSTSPEDLIKEEAHRLSRLVQLAAEEAILRGEEYGIEVYVDGYRFLHLEENKWQPISGDKLLRDRELSNDMEIEMRLEDTEISIEGALDTLSEKKSAAGEDSDEEFNDSEKDKKEAFKPHVYLLSSGEITPEFDIRFYILGVKTSYIVKGLFDGTLTTEVSDL